MQPDPSNLMKRIDLTIPLVGFYDAPDVEPFEPLVRPEPKKNICVFAFYENWLRGETLHITKENYGCGGCGHWLFDIETRSKEELLKFLVNGEGLKSSYELMNRWTEKRQPYRPQHPNILMGPLREDQYEYARSITFFVNPDQLSALMIGAQYNNAPEDPPPVLAPFGSGCMMLVILFENFAVPQAIIGTTDIAMRQYLPPDILAFTVTKPMFKQLCELDEKSFLYKPFWKNLRKARGYKSL
jgi:hypothetical protein